MYIIERARDVLLKMVTTQRGFAGTGCAGGTGGGVFGECVLSNLMDRLVHVHVVVTSGHGMRDVQLLAAVRLT